MNVTLGGLTAAGKTTHGKLLAVELGFSYVSSTEILLRLTGVPWEDGIWSKRYEELMEARLRGEVDELLDRTLLDLAESEDHCVFDSWILGWISPTPILRIWIESDFDSRIRKCFVSHGGQVSTDECADLVRRKDAESRVIFQRRHNFDIFTARSRYDVILDNTHLIPQASRQCSDRGISVFSGVMSAVVERLASNHSDGELLELMGSYPREIRGFPSREMY